MKFLCPRHRRMFANLSLKEQNDLWMFWMENAFTFCENRDTEKVIMVTGSAFDLACLARSRHPDTMHVELTLSAILLCRALRDNHDLAAADEVLLRALDSLQSVELGQYSPSGGYNTDQCIEILLDRSRHPGFFAQYLNWPEFPFSDDTRAARRARPRRLLWPTGPAPMMVH